MTTNNKFMLSMATIAILSGSSVALGAESELKVEGTELKLGADKVTITNGVANVAPKDADKTNDIAIKSKLDSKIGTDTMTQLNITAKEAAVNVGTAGQSAAVSVGGTAPANGAVSADGYGVNIDAKSVALAGANGQETQLNVNQNSTITTSDTAGTSVGANSAINIANGKNLTVNGGLTTSDTTSKINVNGGSLNLNGDLTATNGNISLGKDGALNVTGKLTGGTAGTISLSGGTMSVGGALTQSQTTIELGGGTLNVNGGGTLDGTKLTLTNGGTLNFGGGASADKPTATAISGAVSTEKDKATNVNLSQNTKVTFSGDLTLTNNTAAALDKINLNGGVLEVKKLTADATNLNTLGGGVINFTGDGSKITNDLTIASGTTLKFSSSTNTTGTTFDTLTASGSSKLDFAQGTMKVTNLTTNASNISFDKTKGGTIELANDGKSTISGHLTLGGEDGKAGKIVISSAAIAGTNKANELSVDKLSLTQKGSITLGGGVLNVAQGLNADNAKTQIVLKDGGTINFNGGNSVIKGEQFATTASKDTLLNVNSGAGVSFESLDLKDDRSKLTLNGGVVNMGALTTTKAESLDLKQGTLNFVGVLDENGEIQKKTSNLTSFADSVKNAGEGTFINFGNGSEVSIGGADANLNLAETKAQVNFGVGSLVKIGEGSKGTLTTAASKSLNLGGQVELGKLVSQSSADSSLTNVNFGSASVSLSGNLVGKDTTKFTIGTDKDGNSVIGANSEKVEIGDTTAANSALTLKSGVVTTNAALTTATGSKLVFGGGSLNVGADGSLTIADTSKNLELKDGVGGLITLKGDGTKGGAMTISDGALDLSKTSLGIKIENGGKLTTTKASKISGSGNAIQLSDYTGIRVYGDITTAANGEFSYNKMAI